MPLSFFALAFHNKLEFYDTSAHIDRGDDPARSCRNLMIFGQ